MKRSRTSDHRPELGTPADHRSGRLSISYIVSILGEAHTLRRDGHQERANELFDRARKLEKERVALSLGNYIAISAAEEEQFGMPGSGMWHAKHVLSHMTSAIS